MDASVDAYPATEVRAELNRILSSSNFVTSDRNRRFLEHVIEEALAGRGDRLKAYNIATMVFGRPTDFDAQLDPVVRMEAGRVRRALERFYLIEGQPGVLRISIPKGGYQPQFSAPATMAVERMGPELAKTHPVFVSQFEAGGTAAPHNLNVGFTRQFMVRLHQLGHEVVAEPQIDPAVRILTGHLELSADVLSVTALMVEASGRVLWGDSVKISVPAGQTIFAIRDKTVEHLANTLHGYLSRQANDPLAPPAPLEM